MTLTEVEIKEILLEASCKDWEDPNYYGIGRKRTNVVKVSPETGLIFITGDKDVGNEHITIRHSGTVREYRKQTLPSEFTLPPPPIFYHFVADKIYLMGELIDVSFDSIYEATLELPHSMKVKYRLVLLGQTKIVKTMYPVESDRRKKPEFVMTYNTKYEHSLATGIVTTEYDFKDSNEHTRFVLRVTYYTFNQLEQREIFSTKKGKANTLLYYTDQLPSVRNMEHLAIFAPSFKFPEEEAIVNNHRFRETYLT